MGAEIRYLLAASGATINDNREAINDATMMSATSELVQEDPMPTRAGSYLAALLRDTQAPRTQAQSTVASLVNAAQTALDANNLFANGTMINKINEAVKIAARPIRAISGIMAEKQRQPAKHTSASEAPPVSPSLAKEDSAAWRERKYDSGGSGAAAPGHTTGSMSSVPRSRGMVYGDMVDGAKYASLYTTHVPNEPRQRKPGSIVRRIISIQGTTVKKGIRHINDSDVTFPADDVLSAQRHIAAGHYVLLVNFRIEPLLEVHGRRLGVLL